MAKVMVRFLKPNGKHQPGDLAGVDSEFAEKLVNADPPRAMYVEEGDEEGKAAVERANRRSAVRKMKAAELKKKEDAKIKEGKEFLEKNPDALKDVAKAKGDEKKKSKKKPINLDG